MNPFPARVPFLGTSWENNSTCVQVTKFNSCSTTGSESQLTDTHIDENEKQKMFRRLYKIKSTNLVNPFPSQDTLSGNVKKEVDLFSVDFDSVVDFCKKKDDSAMLLSYIVLFVSHLQNFERQSKQIKN